MNEIALEYAAALRALFACLRAGGEGAEAAFSAVEVLRPRIPLVDGQPVSEFTGEALRLAALSPWSFEELALKLSHEGQLDAALRLIGVAEVLMPDQDGVSLAVLWARRGLSVEGARTLEAIAKDCTRHIDARISAVAALGEVAALDELVRCGSALARELIRRRDYFSAALVAEVMALAIEAAATSAGARGAGAAGATRPSLS
ncbi:MAG: hypothetical protein ACYC8T_20055 [Myxococcaceae bacterium]